MVALTALLFVCAIVVLISVRLSEPWAAKLAYSSVIVGGIAAILTVIVQMESVAPTPILASAKVDGYTGNMVCLNSWISEASPLAVFEEERRARMDNATDGQGPAADTDGAWLEGTVYLTVQGKSEAQVVLTDLRVVVLERREPIEGTEITSSCGDPGEMRSLNVDLDSKPPEVRPYLDPQIRTGKSPPLSSKPIEFPYEVALSDVETFFIHATTRACDCLWEVELDWASQGRTGTLTVDNGGTPFRTSSNANVRAKCRPGEFDDCPSEAWTVVSQDPLGRFIRVRPGESISIAWKVRNIGPLAWESGKYSFVPFRSGSRPDPINLPDILIDASVAPGRVVELTTEIEAPDVPGTYDILYEIEDATGQSLDGGVSIDLIVER